MPYTNAYMTPLTYGQVLEQFGSDEPFQYWLADLVAEAFNLYAGERLLPGHNSVFQNLTVDRTATMDLMVVIVAWWKESREHHFRSIKRHIEDTLRAQFPGRTIELALNRGGAPPKQPIDFSRHIEDIFVGEEYNRLRTCLLHNAAIGSLGGLLQLRAQTILAITNGDQQCLDQVNAKLAEMGFALAPTHR